ncbi:MAG: glycosyltransferase family 2 protein [Gammaproteobacteria bacterium]|nr:glycosyltransferase family 2 protein [Gammaproteobacteria bacterium]
MYRNLRVGVVIPALNEEQSIALVVTGLRALRNEDQSTVVDELVVCDNGSTDATALRARDAGASVVHEPERGYGKACLAALGALQRSDVALFIDGDHAFDPAQATTLLDGIANGADLVIGSRSLGHTAPRALAPGQALGNRIICTVIRRLWGQRVTDLGPYRAIRVQALARLNMTDTRFGWTVEMQVKALQLGLKMIEIPVDTRVRIGTSKISGTLRGAILASSGILYMIFKLRWRQFRRKPITEAIQP